MKSLTLFITSLFSLLLISCGSVDAESTLRQAENDLQDGNITLAASGCDMLTDSASEHQLSATQMCRVAIIYAKLSDMAENQDYMASATQCFERAIDLDNRTDSLDRYIETLDVDTQGVVSLIREVSRAMSTTYDYSQEHDEDSDMPAEDTDDSNA